MLYFTEEEPRLSTISICDDIQDPTENFSKKKGVNFVWMYMVQALWHPILYIELDPRTNRLPRRDYLEIASSNIKEKLYLGTS